MLINDDHTIILQNSLSNSRLNLSKFLLEQDLLVQEKFDLDRYKYHLNHLYYAFVKEMRNNLLSLTINEGQTVYLKSLLSSFELLDYQLKESLLSSTKVSYIESCELNHNNSPKEYSSSHLSDQLHFVLYQKHIIQESINLIGELSKNCHCSLYDNYTQKISWQDELSEFYPEMTRIKGEMNHIMSLEGRISFLEDERKNLAKNLLKEGKDLYSSPINYFFESRMECLREILILLSNLAVGSGEQNAKPVKGQGINTLRWTAKKVDLVELIYGLYHIGSFNHGEANINDIKMLFTNISNVKPNDVYHIYAEIRSRKIDRTKFLDQMIRVLKEKMLELDEKM